jgi:hypothetical protein
MSPEIRVGDDEREAAVAALGEHYAAGRLTKEEYDERADLAWQARTRSQLFPLFADLPRPPAVAASAARPAVDGRGARTGTRTGGGRGWSAPAVLLVVLVAFLLAGKAPFLLIAVIAGVLFFRHQHAPHRRGPWGPR